MGKILLDYAFPFNEIEGTPDVNLAYLHKVAVGVKPNQTLAEPYAVEVYNPEEAKLHTDNVAIDKLFAGGLNRITLIVTDTLDNGDALLTTDDFFTFGISGDFDESEATAFSPSTFTGVVYSTATTKTAAISLAKAQAEQKQKLEQQMVTQELKIRAAKAGSKERTTAANAYAKAAGELAKMPNRCVFYDEGYNTEGSHFAFGKLLSGTYWRDQQYIQAASGSSDWWTATDLGEAESLFDAGVSFWLSDDEYGVRLGFFGVGGNGITYPYIKEEIKRIVQSDGVKYLSINQSKKTQTERIRLEDYLNASIKPYLFAPYYYLNPTSTNQIKLYDSNERYILTGQMHTDITDPIWRVKIEAIQGDV